MSTVIKVYLNAPFGKIFTSQAELDILVQDKVFVAIDDFTVTKSSLQEQIHGAQELFYYKFVPIDQNNPLTERVIKRVEFVNDRAELSPDISYFVLYGKLYYIKMEICVVF